MLYLAIALWCPTGRVGLPGFSMRAARLCLLLQATLPDANAATFSEHGLDYNWGDKVTPFCASDVAGERDDCDAGDPYEENLGMCGWTENESLTCAQSSNRLLLT